jgi:WD40 repeat protein
MTDDPSPGSDDLDFLDQFLAEYAAADDRPALLARRVAERPHLAGECRLLAGFDALSALRVPGEVAGVELLGEVGRGGMGFVYEGVEKSVGRAVAVKLCPAVGDAAGRDRFLAECRALAGLHQTSIIPVLAAGREGLWLYCVMPLIEGESLAELVRRGRSFGPAPLPPLPALIGGPEADQPGAGPGRPSPAYIRSAVEVLILAADAVAYAHQRGVWHLDLKPANLMVDETGHCWVIDFGLARAARNEAPAGAGGPTCLTTAYAAPEQWRGEGDARSDVWGLGATLYEVVTLRRPFPDRALNEAPPDPSRERPPPPPHALCSEVSADLSAICLRALAPEPDRRYQSVAAFASDLRRWLNGEEPAARPWSPLVRLRDLARRHCAWAVATGASLFGLVVALALVWRGEQIRARQATAEAEAAVARANLRREADAHTQARVWNLIEQARDRMESPAAGRRADVRRLLLTAARERRKISDPSTARAFDLPLRSLYVQSLGLIDATTPATRLALSPSAFFDRPTDIHPDGHLLAIGTAIRPVVWRRGQAPPEVPGESVAPRSRVAYGPLGRHLAEILPAMGGLRVWDGEAARLLGEPIPAKETGAAVLAVWFDASETRLRAARANGRVSSWELPAMTPAGEWKPRAGAFTAAAFAPDGNTVAFGDAAGVVSVTDSTGAVMFRLAVPTGRAVESLAWSPDALRIAAGTTDGTVHVFDRSGAPLFRVAVSSSGASHVGFSPDGRWLTSHFRNQGMRIWDAHTGRLLLTGSLPNWGFSRDGRTFAGAGTREIAFVDLHLPEAADRYEGHMTPVEHLAWAPGGRRFATLSSDFQLRVWGTERPGSAAAMFTVPPSDGFWAAQGAIALSKDGRLLAYACGGRNRSRVVVWDVASAKEVAGWELPGGFEKLAAVGPGQFASVREEITPGTRNVTTVARLLEVGKPLQAGRVIRQPDPQDRARFIDHWLLPDGNHYLWSGPREPSAGRRVELYEVRSGRLLWRVTPPESTGDSAPACVLSENLRELLVRDDRGSESLYAYPTREPRPVPGRTYSTSADGRWLLEGLLSENGLPRAAVLRRGDSAEPWVEFPIRDFTAPTGGQYLFSPDGRHLAWGSTSGTVAVVDLAKLEQEVNQFEAEIAALE